MSEEKHPNHERNKEQDREDKLREMVGGVLATGLWFFLDLYFLYPENHQAAWWLGLLFIAFQLIQNSFMRLRTTVIAIAIMTLGGGVGSFFLPPKIPQETETHGWLIPANDPSPPNPCERFRPTPPNAIAIFFGSNCAWTIHDQQTIFEVHGRSLVAFERNKKGEITFSADVFDEVGNLVARIERGEFHLVQSAISYDTRSEDRSTLAVYDRQGHEMLYLRFLNIGAILIRGVFRAPNFPQPLVVTNDGMGVPPVMFAHMCFQAGNGVGAIYEVK